jgi:hypothetical protein
MKQPIVIAGLLSLGLVVADAGLATQSAAQEYHTGDSLRQQRFREEGKQLDLTGFLQADTDARSRDFLFNGPQEHDFTVEEAGTYLFESRVPANMSDNYRLAAVLLDDQGQVLARSEALGQNGGLAMRQRLQPGDHVLRVEGELFGSRVEKAGISYQIVVSGLDAQGRRIDDGVSDGGGFFFSGKERQGRRTAFVRGNRGDVPSVSAPSRSTSAATGAAAASRGEGAAGGESGASSAPRRDASVQQEPQQQPRKQPPQGFETIVTDVKIRARGEVLTFDVAEAGTIAITTSTYPPGYENTYRIELEVLDENGRVVAKDAGEGFDGNIDLRTRLSPGRYRIRVQGQKFGSAHSGVNNYELKVVQLDRQ